ncbi:MAG TPA: radical SAM protein [Spirochaetota bacterium]|nr:radical SAM protein [Spirochaetota bacterium]HPS85875.1 radical SAM protein [Spirochaetota bacterium]
MKLKVYEIFYSIQGETTTAGFTSLFIRLAGCNLNCSWCDTVKAKDDGREMDVDSIIDEVNKNRPFHHVTLTGGEPLIQDGAIHLLQRLSEEGYKTQVETNGTVVFETIPDNVRIITDIKTPSSGEENSFNEENIKHLRKDDEIKFVIGMMEDYEFAKSFIKNKLKGVESVINFSPASGMIEPWVLASMIIKDKLNVRLNIQLHKIAKFA